MTIFFDTKQAFEIFGLVQFHTHAQKFSPKGKKPLSLSTTHIIIFFQPCHSRPTFRWGSWIRLIYGGSKEVTHKRKSPICKWTNLYVYWTCLVRRVFLPIRHARRYTNTHKHFPYTCVTQKKPTMIPRVLLHPYSLCCENAPRRIVSNIGPHGRILAKS